MSELTKRYEKVSSEASDAMTRARKSLKAVLDGLEGLSTLQPDVQEVLDKASVVPDSETLSDLEAFLEMGFDEIARKIREFDEMLDDLAVSLDSIQVDI